MAHIINTRERKASIREGLGRALGVTQKSHHKERSRHRQYRPEDDDVEEGRKIVYVYRPRGNEHLPRGEPRHQRISRSQDVTSSINATRNSQSRSNSSHNERSRRRSSRPHHRSVSDVAPRWSVRTGEDEMGESRSREKLTRRPTTRKRHSERGIDLGGHPRATRYGISITFHQNIFNNLTRSSSMREPSSPPAPPPLQRSNTTTRSHTTRNDGPKNTENPSSIAKEPGQSSKVVYSLFGLPNVVQPEKR